MVGPIPHDPRLTRLAVSYLSRRARSRSEVETYLLRKRTPEQSVNDVALVMQYLDTIQLIDDEQFATECARSYLNQGKGPFRIKQTLQQKGVASEIIESTLFTLGSDRITQSALKIAQKKIKQTSFDLSQPYAQAKLSNYLYSRGYSATTCRAVIDELPIKAVE